jgi:DNA mismatch repair protein MutL
VHLFIEMPLDAVDVNVHPTKAEVRFREQSLVHELVRRALGDALGRGPAPELTLTAPTALPPVPGQSTLPGVLPGGIPGQRWMPAVGAPSATGGVAPLQVPDGGAGAASSSGVTASSASAAPPAALAPGPTLRPLLPLGQFRDTFIIAIDDEGVAIVDQHVAHERVLFERTMERLTSGRLESQRLLEPLLLELPPGARQALADHAVDLDRLGFEVDAFGGDAVRVSAVPAVIRREAIDATVRALAQDLDGLDRGAPLDAALKRLAATIACHAAVKANDRLTYEKMVHILEELRATAYSTICPHGRPVMLRITRREIEKNFQRI